MSFLTDFDIKCTCGFPSNNDHRKNCPVYIAIWDKETGLPSIGINNEKELQEYVDKMS